MVILQWRNFRQKGFKILIFSKENLDEKGYNMEDNRKTRLKDVNLQKRKSLSMYNRQFSARGLLCWVVFYLVPSRVDNMIHSTGGNLNKMNFCTHPLRRHQVNHSINTLFLQCLGRRFLIMAEEVCSHPLIGPSHFTQSSITPRYISHLQSMW